jgi:hypothetical protein
VNEYVLPALCVITYSGTLEQVRQLGDVDGDPTRLVAVGDAERP